MTGPQYADLELTVEPDITEVVVRDAPHFRRLTLVLFVLLLAVTLGIAWSVWR